MSLSQSIRKKKRTSGLDSKRQSKYQAVPQPKFQDDPIEQLSPHVLLQIQSNRNDDQVIPGEMTEIKDNETNNLSPFAFKSSNALPTTIVRGSFHRKAGIRETFNMSGSYVLRTVEIKRETGRSIGFYITQGDGLKRSDGIFVSRVSLGSVVDVNNLLHVGEEIVKVNGVDVTKLPLDDVVILMQNLHSKLVLTIKLQTSATILRSFSSRKQMPTVFRHRELVDESHSQNNYPREIQSLLQERKASASVDSRVHDALEEESISRPPVDITQETEELHSLVIKSLSNTKHTNHESEADIPQVPLASSTPILRSREKQRVSCHSHTESPNSSSPPTPPTSPLPNVSSSSGSSASLQSPPQSPSTSSLVEPLALITVQHESNSLSSSPTTETPNMPVLHSHFPLHEPPPSFQPIQPSPPSSPPPIPHTHPPVLPSPRNSLPSLPSTSFLPSSPSLPISLPPALPSLPISLPPAPPSLPISLPPAPPSLPISLPPAPPSLPITLPPSPHTPPPSPPTSLPPAPHTSSPIKSSPSSFIPPSPHTSLPTFLFPPLSKPPPPPSDNSGSEDEDIFSLKDIEQGLKNWIESDYESS